MTPLERLRLAAALCHTVDGAELRLTTDRGERIIVSHHPAADIDPCKMRGVVAASACPSNPDFSGRIVDISIGGALVDLGGGVHSTKIGGEEQRWVASVLHHDHVADLLDAVGLDVVLDETMHACLKPDGDLGVTLVAITSSSDAHRHALDEIAAQAAAACFVGELVSSVSDVSQTSDRSGRRS